MLHTLNKAWVKILANQLDSGHLSSVLFVVTNSAEIELVIRTCHHVADKYTMVNEDRVRQSMQAQDSFPMYDDILISHEIHDSGMKSFLCQHCRRKGA